MKIVLASQSPRRKELMGLFNRPFTVRVADIDETMDPNADPRREVARVSRCKAEAVDRQPGEVVIAADTIVVCDGVVLGKPKSEEEAVKMLCMLSGRAHEVMTGLTVLADGICKCGTEVTEVVFRDLTPQEICEYVESGEPMDKAGSYGIQGGAALFVEAIMGDYYNVVGLPVCRLGQILRMLEEY